MTEGWMCPKCGSVYSPSTPECYKCSAKQVQDAYGTATYPLCWHCRRPIGVPAELGGCGCTTAELIGYRYREMYND